MKGAFGMEHQILKPNSFHCELEEAGLGFRCSNCSTYYKEHMTKSWADPNQAACQGENFPTLLLSSACLCIKLIEHEGKSIVDILVFQTFLLARTNHYQACNWS